MSRGLGLASKVAGSRPSTGDGRHTVRNSKVRDGEMCGDKGAEVRPETVMAGWR